MKDFARSIVCNAKAEVAKVGNAKCGNAEIFKDGNVWVVLYAEGTKSKEFKTEAEAKKFAAQVGNSKTGNSMEEVGNANTHLTASNSGELWLNYDGTGEMYDPIELGRYDFSGKSEAMSVVRDLEQLKRKAEQKVKDADKFINAIKQWASGLK